MAFDSEPTFAHGQAPHTAVLLCNLGTPDAPTPAAVRRYLAEFLSDPRVVEIPRLLWWPILHGIILRLRPARSAKKYASIWRPEGSPLKFWTERQAQALGTALHQQGHAVRVDYAMTYGKPSIASALHKLRSEGATRVLVVPAYPQYSATTTASVLDRVCAWAAKTRHVPELRFINRYHEDVGYIQALAGSIARHWEQHGKPDQLVMSFHGVPERTLHLGDPYHCECHKTARLLASELGLTKDQYRLTFQSRFGKAKWLEPYTEPTLVALAQAGMRRVDVVCPGFTSDCLETLEEINQEAREAFLQAGGKEFNYVACLNDDAQWLAALADIVCRHLAGWPTQVSPDAAALEQQRTQALALGARQ
jgi:protoporphyrin/coproporphyrin ferrochelatase